MRSYDAMYLFKVVFYKKSWNYGKQRKQKKMQNKNHAKVTAATTAMYYLVVKETVHKLVRSFA